MRLEEIRTRCFPFMLPPITQWQTNRHRTQTLPTGEMTGERPATSTQGFNNIKIYKPK